MRITLLFLHVTGSSTLFINWPASLLNGNVETLSWYMVVLSFLFSCGISSRFFWIRVKYQDCCNPAARMAFSTWQDPSRAAQSYLDIRTYRTGRLIRLTAPLSSLGEFSKHTKMSLLLVHPPKREENILLKRTESLKENVANFWSLVHNDHTLVFIHLYPTNIFFGFLEIAAQ